MQTARMIKSAGRKEQEDNKGDERNDNGKKQQRGRRKEERNINFKVIRDHKRKKDEGGTEIEGISQREQRKKEAKREKEKMLKRQEETRRHLFGKSGSRMQHRSAGEEYGWKVNWSKSK